MRRSILSQKKLITKIIFITAPVFLSFFVLLGFWVENLLKEQIFGNTHELLRSMTKAESVEINQHFDMLSQLGDNTAKVVKEWLVEEEGISRKEFNRKYKIIDGALRTDIKAYPDSNISGLFLSSLTKLTPEIVEIISRTENKFVEYAKAASPFVNSTYFITRHQLIRIYEKDWALKIESDHDFRKDSFYNIATPKNNPHRERKWTTPYYDDIWKCWFTSLVVPVYINDEFIGVIGHDVVLGDIYNFIASQKYFESGYGILTDSDMNIIIHPHYMDKFSEALEEGRLVNLRELDNPELNSRLEKAVNEIHQGAASSQSIITTHGKDHYLITTKLGLLDWYYSISVPVDELYDSISSFEIVFYSGSIVASLVLFVFVIVIIWYSVIGPIKKLQIVTEKFVAGDFEKSVEINSSDEIGKLASSFNKMITKINQTIEKIKATEEKYHGIFDNAVDGIFQSTIEGRFLSVNPAAAKILGYDSPRDMINSIKDIAKDFYVNKNRRAEFISKFDNSDVIKGWEVRAYKKDKTIIWLTYNVRCIRDNDGNISLFEGLFTDITKRKVYEEILKYSNTIMQAQQETSPDGILIVDMNQKIIDCNQKFIDLWKVPEDIINSGSDKLLREYNAPKIVDSGKFLRKINTLYNNPTEKSFDEIELKDGTIMERFSSPLMSKEGKNYGRIWYFKDVTETRNAQKVLIQAKEMAELSEKIKSEFLAQVSHEIRTPISAILSFSNLIKDELHDKVDPDLQEGFLTINRAGRRIIRTIDLILNMSEMQSGGYEYNGRNLDLYDDILLFTFGEYKQLALDKDLNLTLNQNTENTSVYADEYTVSQIFQNLIDNAIKYTIEGSVDILVGRNEKDELEIKVKDTGIGISEEYLPHLFSAFTQEEQGYTRKFEGNGLGLALIQKYCELNNADIAVESVKNVGTTFTVTFHQ